MFICLNICNLCPGLEGAHMQGQAEKLRMRCAERISKEQHLWWGKGSLFYGLQEPALLHPQPSPIGSDFAPISASVTLLFLETLSRKLKLRLNWSIFKTQSEWFNFSSFLTKRSLMSHPDHFQASQSPQSLCLHHDLPNPNKHLHLRVIFTAM